MEWHRMDMVGAQGCKVYPDGHSWCGCFQYVPDNLKYLELLSDSK